MIITGASEGVLSYQKIKVLKQLKDKFEPKKKRRIFNEITPGSDEEIAGEITYRLDKSLYSVKNIERALYIINKAKVSMKIYKDFVEEIKDFLNSDDELSDDELNEKYSKWLSKVKYLVDSTRIRYFRLLTTEDIQKDLEFRRKVRTRSDFRKYFAPQMNPALYFNKIVIHTAIPEEPFLQINIPVELSYQTYELDKINLTEQEGKFKLIKSIKKIEKTLNKELENTSVYIDKLSMIKKKIEIYQANLKATLNILPDEIQPSIRIEDIEDAKINFGVVTNKTKKGMVFNFTA